MSTSESVSPITGRRGGPQDVGTPSIFIEACRRTFGEIGFDLAASKANHVCPKPDYYTEKNDALHPDTGWPRYRNKSAAQITNKKPLSVQWNWLNPPYCVDPDVKVLKDDLTWASASDIHVGDELLAFTHDRVGGSIGGKGKDRDRTFCRSTVVATDRLKSPKLQLHTTEGDITVSRDHQFLAKHSRSDTLQWYKAEDLTRGMLMPYFGKPWSFDNSRSAGYVAGFMDGEGHVSKTGAMGYSQLEGPVAEYMRGETFKRGFESIVENVEQKSNGKALEHVVILGGIAERLRFLGAIRPHRLFAKHPLIWEGRTLRSRSSQLIEVLGSTKLKPGPVVAIQTTSKTLITDGYYSHNCNIYPWADRCVYEALRGRDTMMLVPASLDTAWWGDWVDGNAWWCGLKGRITFIGHTQGYPRALALILFSSVWRPTPFLKKMGFTTTQEFTSTPGYFGQWDWTSVVERGSCLERPDL